MNQEQLEDKIDELKYHFDEDFGSAVGRKEDKMKAYSYKKSNKERSLIAEEFKKHLALKGFEVEERNPKQDGSLIELWVDLTFNY